MKQRAMDAHPHYGCVGIGKSPFIGWDAPPDVGVPLCPSASADRCRLNGTTALKLAEVLREQPTQSSKNDEPKGKRSRTAGADPRMKAPSRSKMGEPC